MLFHLLSEYINIFRYLTFRNVGAAITSFVLMLWLAPFVINKLREMRFGQQVREEGPSSHLVKTGTPTMGGILTWSVVIFSTLLWGAWNGFVLITCLSVFLFGIIGFIDDYAKIKQKDTKGLSAKGKLLVQSSFAFIVLGLIYLMPQYHQKSETLELDFIDKNFNIIASTNVILTQDWKWSVSYPSGTKKGQHALVGSQYDPETGKNKQGKYFNIPALVENKIDTQIFSSKVLEDDGFKVITDITRNSTDDKGDIYNKSQKSMTN
jgi:hypothetical protein